MYKKGHYADTYEHMYNTGKPTTIQTNKETNKAFHQHTHQSKHIQTFKMQVKYKIQREKEKTQRAQQDKHTKLTKHTLGLAVSHV